jgi:hypothetical protein
MSARFIGSGSRIPCDCQLLERHPDFHDGIDRDAVPQVVGGGPLMGAGHSLTLVGRALSTASKCQVSRMR